jgi:hypothetical protein
LIIEIAYKLLDDGTYWYTQFVHLSIMSPMFTIMPLQIQTETLNIKRERIERAYIDILYKDLNHELTLLHETHPPIPEAASISPCISLNINSQIIN